MSERRSQLARAAEGLRGASSLLVITGAGISAESGIPTFRGAGGLWEGFRAEDLATPEAFARDPERVWRWYRWRAGLYARCRPNAAHHVIAAMEARYERFLLATQNVDGLHRRAGSRKLSELHGTITHMRCVGCGAVALMAPEVPGRAPVPACEACGAMMRPHILWFGETYWPGVLEQAQAAALSADVVLVVGTSALVWPPTALALAGKQHGAFLIDVNPDTTHLSEAADVHLAAPAGEALPELWRRCDGAPPQEIPR